jgi:hypothetical protein
METNLQRVKSAGDVEINGLPLFLVEYSDAPDVVSVLSDDEGSPVAQARGVRLHRAISTRSEVVASYDPELDTTPLDFMAGIESAVFASARPGVPDGDYLWQLSVVLGGEESMESGTFVMTGSRAATSEEAAALDATWPGWRDACREFDAGGRD